MGVQGMSDKQEVRIGNCLDLLKQMPADSIDVVVTSPPYWALRDYGSDPVIWGGEPGCDHTWEDHTEPARGGVGETANVGANKDGEANNRGHPTVSQYCAKCGAWRGQLGLEPSFYEYIDHLIEIFDEVQRVLKPTGACWVNIGDTYNGTKDGNTDEAKNRKAVSAVRKNKTNDIGRKSLCMIPARFAIAMCEHGWILRNQIIWHKPNVMPQSMTDRFTVDYEPFYFFTKSPKYYYKQVKETMKGPTDKASFGTKKTGNNNPIYSGNHYDASKLDGMRNARTVWSISTQPSDDDHCAMFPISLIERPIKACCPEGGTVLDPFCGSGTTLMYCFKNDIKAIGLEINPEFKGMIERKMNKHQQTLAGWTEADA